MEAMHAAWTDDRLDDLSRRVDEGFNRVHEDLRALRAEMVEQGNQLRGEMAEQGSQLRGEMQGLRGEMRAEMQSLRGEFSSMQRTLIQVAGGMIAAFLAGLLALIATQI